MDVACGGGPARVCVVQLWALFPERIHIPTVVTMSLNECVLCSALRKVICVCICEVNAV
jgi:hypothetical protein